MNIFFSLRLIFLTIWLLQDICLVRIMILQSLFFQLSLAENILHS